jgi:hypothetical protein
MNRMTTLGRTLARPFVATGRFIGRWRWAFGWVLIAVILFALQDNETNDEYVIGWMVFFCYLLAALFAALNSGSDRIIKSINESWQGSLESQRRLTKVYQDSADRYRDMWTEATDERRAANLRTRKIVWLLHDHHLDAIRSGSDELRTELRYLSDRVNRISDSPVCPTGCYDLMEPRADGAWACPSCGVPVPPAEPTPPGAVEVVEIEGTPERQG